MGGQLSKEGMNQVFPQSSHSLERSCLFTWLACRVCRDHAGTSLTPRPQLPYCKYRSCSSLALVRPSWAVGVEEQQAGQIQKMMDALVALPLAIEMRGHFVPGLPCFKQPSCMFTPRPWLRLAWLCIWRSFPATQLFWKLHCDLSWAIRIHWRFKMAR